MFVTLTPSKCGFSMFHFFLVVPPLAVGDVAQLVGVRDERLRHVGKRAPAQMLTPADAVAQLEVPVSRHLGRRRHVIPPVVLTMF